MRKQLFDNRLINRLVAFWPGVCDIQERTATRSVSGGVIDSWTAVEGHTAIPCRFMFAKLIGSANAAEQRRVDLTLGRELPIFALKGYFPVIQRDMRLVYEGRNYNIQGVEFDIEGHLTELRCEVIEV